MAIFQISPTDKILDSALDDNDDVYTIDNFDNVDNIDNIDECNIWNIINPMEIMSISMMKLSLAIATWCNLFLTCIS